MFHITQLQMEVGINQRETLHYLTDQGQDTWKFLVLTLLYFGSFPSGSVVKNLPAMQELQETQVWPLGQEDPLEKGMATHSIILAWRIPRTEELEVGGGGYSPWGCKESDMTEAT